MTVTLTSGQEAASKAFFQFLMSEDRFFVISGSAGTGKTFLMTHLHGNIIPQYETACQLINVPMNYDTVEFTATTNKAAEVLEKGLGIPVSTIHSQMALKVKDNYRTGKQDIRRTDAWKIQRRKIIFIDECSMIGKELFDIILDTFQDSKIVFVGDHAQMAPIDESLSPIYEKVAEENFVVLTEPVRNAGQPALVSLCNQLRDTVETGVFRPIEPSPGAIEYLDNQSMPDMLERVFANNLDPSARILCYTNSRVKDFNAFIREVRGLPSQFRPGDHVVVADNYQSGRISLSVERELTVMEVSDQVREIGYEHLTPDQAPLYVRNIEVVKGGSLSLSIPIPQDEGRHNSVLSCLRQARNWHDYFALKRSAADLRDKAACTVYKSQGSTYGQVFVDIGNIGTSYNSEQVARMLFVAASRARSTVYLFGSLPGRYVSSRKEHAA